MHACGQRVTALYTVLQQQQLLLLLLLQRQSIEM